jgi:DNA-binding Lrp family transcriptional regulator
MQAHHVNEAYVLLNVDYKHQKDIVEKAKKIPTVKSIKTTYGIYDILIILESENMQDIKQAIDVDLHKISGINNLTSLISVS